MRMKCVLILCLFSWGTTQALRAIDALQQATFNRVGIPANWKEGEDVLVGENVSLPLPPRPLPLGPSKFVCLCVFLVQAVSECVGRDFYPGVPRVPWQHVLANGTSTRPGPVPIIRPIGNHNNLLSLGDTLEIWAETVPAIIVVDTWSRDKDKKLSNSTAPIPVRRVDGPYRVSNHVLPVIPGVIVGRWANVSQGVRPATTMVQGDPSARLRLIVSRERRGGKGTRAGAGGGGVHALQK